MKKSITVEVEEIKFSKEDKDNAANVGAIGTGVRAFADSVGKDGKAKNSFSQVRSVNGFQQEVAEGSFIVKYPNGTEQLFSAEEFAALGKSDSKSSAAGYEGDISAPGAQLAHTKLQDSNKEGALNEQGKIVVAENLPEGSKK